MIKGNQRIFHKTDIGARSGTQFLVAADVIGVNMGFKNMRDFHAIVTGQIDMVLHIPFGIHDTGDFGLRTADKLRKTTHAFNSDLFEIHIPVSIFLPIISTGPWSIFTAAQCHWLERFSLSQ